MTSTTFREGALFTFAEYLATSIAFARAFSKATACYAPGGLDVERFKDSKEVYPRMREKGRMLPAVFKYAGSVVEANCHSCFQFMEYGDVSSLQRWYLNSKACLILR